MTVRVPASSANLGPGFDALALALGRYDEVSVTADVTPGLVVEVSGEGAADVARDETNLVVRAIYATYERLGAQRPGLALHCTNTIPHGRGLGSSAAAIVSGVLAAYALTGCDPQARRAEILALATGLEGHPDNVAACLLGGLTIAWTEDGQGRAVRLDPAPDLSAVVLVPARPVSTSVARSLLPPVVAHADAAHAAGRAALLVAAITSRPDLLLAATDDRLHQQYRAPAMPQTVEVVSRLRAQGIPAVVSGAGPSVLALMRLDDHDPEPIATLSAMVGSEWAVMRPPIDLGGAHLTASSPA